MSEGVEIGGRTVPLPVEVRDATNWIATYLVAAGPAQRIADAAGLEVVQPRPGRALAGLGFVRYTDTDLGAYNEFAFSLLVRRHDAPPASAKEQGRELRRQRIGVYIHRLPVDDLFSMESGRGIWGYPKTLARLDRREDPRGTTWTLADADEPVLSMRFRRGFVPWMQKSTPPTYTMLDGVLRLTRWESNPGRVRSRPAGVDLTIGTGPIADELRSLGLPKRALFSARMDRWRARFSAAEVVRPEPAARR